MLMGAYHAERGMDTAKRRQTRTSGYPGDYLYPVSKESKDLLNVAMSPFGANPFKGQLGVSPRYVSAIPIMPEEPYGFGVDRYSEAGLMGESRPTYRDRRGIMAEKTGIDMPLPMHVEPLAQLAFGDPIKGAYGLAPPHFEKSLNKETLWGEPYSKRDFRLQATTGIRPFTEEHQKFARDRKRSKLKKLSSATRDLSTGQRMEKEREAIIRNWREGMY